MEKEEKKKGNTQSCPLWCNNEINETINKSNNK